MFKFAFLAAALFCFQPVFAAAPLDLNQTLAEFHADMHAECMLLAKEEPDPDTEDATDACETIVASIEEALDARVLVQNLIQSSAQDVEKMRLEVLDAPKNAAGKLEPLDRILTVGMTKLIAKIQS